MSNQPELSIKRLLADLGIEVRPSTFTNCRELWRDGEKLGDYTAAEAVTGFLSWEGQE